MFVTYRVWTTSQLWQGNRLPSSNCSRSKVETLEKALLCCHQALSLCPFDDYPDRPTCLNNIGTVMRLRFNHLHEVDDLNQAITHHQNAFPLFPPKNPARYPTLDNLATALYNRFKDLDQIGDRPSYSIFWRSCRFMPRKSSQLLSPCFFEGPFHEVG